MTTTFLDEGTRDPASHAHPTPSRRESMAPEHPEAQSVGQAVPDGIRPRKQSPRVGLALLDPPYTGLHMLRSLSYMLLLVAAPLVAQEPAAPTWKHVELRRFKADEAKQGVAADDEFLYVISNTAVHIPFYSDLGQWNIVIGMGFIIAAFGFATKWE